MTRPIFSRAHLLMLKEHMSGRKPDRHVANLLWAAELTDRYGRPRPAALQALAEMERTPAE